MTTKPHQTKEAVSELLAGLGAEITLAWVHPASRESVLTVLAAAESDKNGRSEFCWLRLANGDLMLGVFPKGDTYFNVEVDAQYPYAQE